MKLNRAGKGVLGAREVTRGGAEQSWKTQSRKQTVGSRLNWGEDTTPVGPLLQGEISADSACEKMWKDKLVSTRT